MTHPLHVPDEVTVPVGKFGSHTPGDLPDTRQRHQFRVVVDAKLGRFTVPGLHDMHAFDAFMGLQTFYKALYTVVSHPGDVRQQQRYIQSVFVGHPDLAATGY
jgi:hypothetical protein